MAKIDPASLKNWIDGDTMKEADYEKERSIVVTAINDLYDKKADKPAGAVLATSGSMAFYINPATGSDSTGTGTSGAPFQSIMKAISMIPQVVVHSVDLNMVAGTFNELVILDGFVGEGIISLIGGSSFGTAPGFNISNSVSVRNCTCRIAVRGVNFTGTAAVAVDVRDSVDVTVQGVNAVASALTVSGIAVNSSNVLVDSCQISSRLRAIDAQNMSTVRSLTNTGVTNTTALYSASSVIFRDGTQPAGTTATSVIGGGQIY